MRTKKAINSVKKLKQNAKILGLVGCGGGIRTLHGTESIGGAADLLEDNKSLAAHLEGFQRHNVQYLAELGENGVQRLLEVLLLDLLVEVVDVDRVIRTVLHFFLKVVILL